MNEEPKIKALKEPTMGDSFGNTYKKWHQTNVARNKNGNEKQ